jgi:hypothetical protein
MKIAISNLAYNNIDCIKNINISLIECVFSKIKNIPDLTNELIIQWSSKIPPHIRPYSVQSITYNCGLLNFNFLDKNIFIIDKIISLSKILNIKRIIFGSPTLRVGEPDLSMFSYIDKALHDTDIIFCIEPNAKIYGGSYFYDIEEIVNFINKNKFKNIYTMIDTHNAWLEQRDIVSDIKTYKNYIKHIHASENGLSGFFSLSAHDLVSKTLREINYEDVITFESQNMCGIDDFLRIYGHNV